MIVYTLNVMIYLIHVTVTNNVKSHKVHYAYFLKDLSKRQLNMLSNDTKLI